MQTSKHEGPRQPSALREEITLPQEQLEQQLERFEIVELPDREAITVIDSRSGLPLALIGSAGLLD